MASGRILVVEDDTALLRRLVAGLTNAGYTADFALDGRAAMRKFEADPPDLVLTDIIMPEREGIETMMAMKAARPDIKVLAMSGGGRIGAEEFLTLAQALGADGCLSKPFRLEDLVRLVGATLDKGASPAKQAAADG